MSVHVVIAPSPDDAPQSRVIVSQRARVYRAEAEARKAEAEMLDDWLKSPEGKRWLGLEEA